MIERRQTARSRVLYGGVVGYNKRQSTADCIIRNFSESGANVEFDNPAVLPDFLDLLVARKNRAFAAKVAWRKLNKAGLAFRKAEQDDPMPLDWILRLRAARSAQRELQGRLDALMSRQ
jgi:PilZ domain